MHSTNSLFGLVRAALSDFSGVPGVATAVCGRVQENDLGVRCPIWYTLLIRDLVTRDCWLSAPEVSSSAESQIQRGTRPAETASRSASIERGAVCYPPQPANCVRCVRRPKKRVSSSNHSCSHVVQRTRECPMSSEVAFRVLCRPVDGESQSCFHAQPFRTEQTAQAQLE
jgi:hypothetical protein